MEEEGQDAATSDAAVPMRRRPLGLYRGRLVIAEDFDVPLPGDIQRYFDGDLMGLLSTMLR